MILERHCGEVGCSAIISMRSSKQQPKAWSASDSTSGQAQPEKSNHPAAHRKTNRNSRSSPLCRTCAVTLAWFSIFTKSNLENTQILPSSQKPKGAYTDGLLLFCVRSRGKYEQLRKSVLGIDANACRPTELSTEANAHTLSFSLVRLRGRASS